MEQLNSDAKPKGAKAHSRVHIDDALAHQESRQKAAFAFSLPGKYLSQPQGVSVMMEFQFLQRRLD